MLLNTFTLFLGGDTVQQLTQPGFLARRAFLLFVRHLRLDPYRAHLQFLNRLYLTWPHHTVVLVNLLLPYIILDSGDFNVIESYFDAMQNKIKAKDTERVLKKT
jgi:hypothetical protein